MVVSPVGTPRNAAICRLGRPPLGLWFKPRGSLQGVSVRIWVLAPLVGGTSGELRPPLPKDWRRWRAHLAAEILAKTGQSYPQKSCGAVSLKSAYLPNTQIRKPKAVALVGSRGELGSPLTTRIQSFVQDESICKSKISSQMRMPIHSWGQGQDGSPNRMGKNGKGRGGEAYGMEWEKMGKVWTGMGWDGTGLERLKRSG